jgi:hypothetical protein
MDWLFYFFIDDAIHAFFWLVGFIYPFALADMLQKDVGY